CDHAYSLRSWTKDRGVGRNRELDRVFTYRPGAVYFARLLLKCALDESWRTAPRDVDRFDDRRCCDVQGRSATGDCLNVDEFEVFTERAEGDRGWRVSRRNARFDRSVRVGIPPFRHKAVIHMPA